MSYRIYFYLGHYSSDIWIDALKAINPALDIKDWPDWGEPDEKPSYAFVWEPEPGLLARYPNIKAIFSMGAGVDHLTRDPDLPKDIPIVRMSDAGLKEGMIEYILMTVLMLHRGIPAMIENQKHRKWERYFARTAADTCVGIMGYGALGKCAVESLKPLGFPLTIWSRSPKKPEEGITHFTGVAGLGDFLNGVDILVCLLPETKETKNLLGRENLTKLPKGACIINAGRGGLIDLEDLIDLMESQHIASAILDVFTEEPLPADHKVWSTQNLIITPHIAAITRPDTAAAFVLDGIENMSSGRLPTTLLDPERGY